MAKMRVNLDHPGMAAMLKSAPVRAELNRRAQRALAAAQSSAPVDTGAYRASLHIEQDTTDRAVVRVVADDPKSVFVEADTGNLARAIDAAR
jgi:hypothetical protein